MKKGIKFIYLFILIVILAVSNGALATFIANLLTMPDSMYNGFGIVLTILVLGIDSYCILWLYLKLEELLSEDDKQ